MAVQDEALRFAAEWEQELRGAAPKTFEAELESKRSRFGEPKSFADYSGSTKRRILNAAEAGLREAVGDPEKVIAVLRDLAERYKMWQVGPDGEILPSAELRDLLAFVMALPEGEAERKRAIRAALGDIPEDEIEMPPLHPSNLEQALNAQMNERLRGFDRRP